MGPKKASAFLDGVPAKGGLARRGCETPIVVEPLSINGLFIRRSAAESQPWLLDEQMGPKHFLNRSGAASRPTVRAAR